MKLTQVYEILSDITKEVLGKEEVLNEDLSNVVDIGGKFSDIMGYDKFVNKLIDKVGRTIFVDKIYKGRVPKLLMDSWEYGSILEKIQVELPDATENDSWNLTDEQTYNPNVFYQPKASVKFWNSKVTFEVSISIADRQVKSAFTSATNLSAFVSMIFNSVKNSITLKVDSLIMRTINNMIAMTIIDDLTIEGDSGDEISIEENSGIKAVNLLTLYNEINVSELTQDKALTDKEFLRFSNMTIKNYVDRIKSFSTLFNIEKKARFTSDEDTRLVLLSLFDSASKTYLEADTFHKDLVALSNLDTIAFWQGSGLEYSFEDTSAIKVTTSSEKVVETDGIVGVLFDKNALGVNNSNQRITNQYNAKGEFNNYFSKVDASYFNDFAENFIVFLIK